MMEALANLLAGLGVALQSSNLAVAFIGAALGTAIGVIPGLGPTATVSLLLPVSVMIEPTSAVILLAGIYYGSQYGGSTASILMRVPGEASSVVSCFEGYPMAKQGRAGAALGMAAFASFIAGIAATLGVAFLGPAFASAALAFGPIEKTALVVFGLTLAASIGEGPRVRHGPWWRSDCFFRPSGSICFPVSNATRSATLICATGLMSLFLQWGCSV